MKRIGSAVALSTMAMAWPAVAAIDKPWQVLDSSTGADSALVGLVLLSQSFPIQV